MNIFKKIEHIRTLPEQARLRYVWISVIFSMLFIFGIWLLSTNSLFRKQAERQDPQFGNSLNELQNDINSSKPSLPDFEELAEQGLRNEGIRNDTDRSGPATDSAQTSD